MSTTSDKINKIILERYHDYVGRRNIPFRKLHADMREKLGDDKFLEYLELQEEDNPRPVYKSPYLETDNFQWNETLIKQFAEKLVGEYFPISLEEAISKFKQSHSSLGKEGEKDWEIVRVRNKYHATDVTHDLEEYNGRKIINGQNYEFVLNSMNHKYHIEAVKRLSDGEVFCIDDITNHGRVTGFNISGTNPLLMFAGFEGGLRSIEIRHIQKAKITDGADRPPLGIIPEWLWKELRYKELDETMKRYTEAKIPVPLDWITEHFGLKNEIQSRENGKKEVLFTTYDLVDMFPGGACFEVHKESLRLTPWSCLPDNLGKIKWVMSDHLYFSTREKAEEYILMHTACLSIADIQSVYSKDRSFVGVDFLMNGILALVQSKLKGEQ